MHHILLLRARITLASIALAIALVPCPAFAVGETIMKTESLKMPQALAAAGFSKFAAMIEAAELVETLESDGPFTCFAPANEAFDAMPEERLKFMMENPKDESVIRWIQYHFVADEALDHAALGKIRGAVTMDGRFITVWVTPGSIRMDKTSPIVRADLMAANGIIHGISQPLQPKEPAEKPESKP